MEFEWDQTKQISNLTKHAIDFEEAKLIWRKKVIDPAETRELLGESRHLALGIIGNDALIIAYTWRNGRRRLSDDDIDEGIAKDMDTFCLADGDAVLVKRKYLRLIEKMARTERSRGWVKPLRRSEIRLLRAG